jgi:hypothetical protein
MGQLAELFIKKTYGSFTYDVRFIGRSKIPKNNRTSYVNAPLDEIGVGHHDFILPV